MVKVSGALSVQIMIRCRGGGGGGGVGVGVLVLVVGAAVVAVAAAAAAVVVLPPHHLPPPPPPAEPLSEITGHWEKMRIDCILGKWEGQISSGTSASMLAGTPGRQRSPIEVGDNGGGVVMAISEGPMRIYRPQPPAAESTHLCLPILAPRDRNRNLHLNIHANRWQRPQVTNTILEWDWGI